jgi:hypothetical protein
VGRRGRAPHGALTGGPPAPPLPILGDVQQRDLRVGDVERGATARRLERALREGRISLDEFDERVAAVWRCRTRGQLDELTADLPPDLW